MNANHTDTKKRTVTYPRKKKCTEAKANANDLNDFTIRDKVLELLEPAVASLAGLSDNDIDIVKDNLSKNHDEILEVERNTRGQASCERWYVERNMRLTASNFGGVIRRRKSIYPKSLLDKILESRANEKSPAPCIWGKENETVAVQKYFKTKKSQGKQVTVCAQVGFIVNPVYPWLGASPDFLIRDLQEESQFGIGEVKCPFAKTEMSLEEACEDKKFYLMNTNGKVTLKPNHLYYYQLQGSMATLRLKWSDFVVYTKNALHIERIYFDTKFWETKMLPELTSFYFDYLASKLHNKI